MKLSIMQPYLFPYIFLYSLIKAADKFVVYDAVAYIKQGFINRNRILVNGKPKMFTIPLHKASSFTMINDIEINLKEYDIFRKKFFKTLEQNYHKAPYYVEVINLITKSLPSFCYFISELATNSINNVCEYLSIPTTIIETAIYYDNKELRGMERVIDICKKENATTYINSIGGQKLYSKEHFEKEGIQLLFLEPKEIKYKQFGKPFVPNLSIIDVLMHNSPEETNKILDRYELI